MNLKTRFADILVLSLRPTQLTLAASAALMAVSLVYGILTGSATHFSHDWINWIIAAAFAGYSISSGYCSLVTTRSAYATVIHYGSAITGVMLWTIVFAIELASQHPNPIAVHLMPVIAEAWAIAQLASHVRQKDRRAL